MKTKIILGVVLLVGVGIGSYIYKNKYSFFKYLPAVSNEQVKNLNGKLYDEKEKLFSGRIKEASEDYTNIYSYKNGELNGLNVIYYKNNIKEIGHWKDGKQNGVFQLYTEEGILVDDANFKDGERDGLTEQYYSDTGNLRAKAVYKNGVLHGEFKYCFPNGHTRAIANYENGNLNGKFDEYYENGNLKLTGLYKENLQEGEWQYFNEDKNLVSKVNYKDGELNGIKEDYHRNGNIWTRQEFKNNTPEGIYEVYYEDGNPQLKAVIKDGQIVEENFFNPDGTVSGNSDNITISESDEKITIEEISDDKIVISENSEDFSKELER